ncbi:MAG: flavodoxin-dependent (E)-4-hydroxy-3-methylbut-2-enyl-diphosphate synthase [Candidatus Omnitrophica bacterium]|nr:flavodoxin-dependent (E)-4-hydroxy-3-methylbut-2-enyl-diphosphate synthase [Candidatus Omnitrophota bacterium]
MRRRKTRKVKIGNVEIGGNAPVSIQSMTKTDTKDVAAVLREIDGLKKAGCEIVRIAVKDASSVNPFKKIIEKARMPVEADIHFIPQLALDAIDAGAAAIRLNPGNIKRPEDIRAIIRSAKAAKIPIRIGVNSGSVGIKTKRMSDGMVKSALDYAKIFEKTGFRDIMISLKSSDVRETIEAYRKMAALCDYPFHLGITASGPFLGATVKSSIGIGTLLHEGIGDTIRVSLTDISVKEVDVAKEILSSLRLRHFGPEIISCPTCGRCQVDIIGIVENLQKKLSTVSGRRSAEKNIQIAVMGCEVNGPGEAAHADMGIAAGKKSGVLFKKGKVIRRINEKDFTRELIKELRKTRS